MNEHGYCRFSKGKENYLRFSFEGMTTDYTDNILPTGSKGMIISHLSDLLKPEKPLAP